MKINKQIGNRGFTLVELMIVIVIIGVLAALASFGFIEYVKKSKSAEADEFVKKIGDGAKVYFTSEQKCGGDETWHPDDHCKATGDSSKDPKTGFPVLYEHKTFCGGDAAKFKSMDNPPKGGGKSVPTYNAGSAITDAKRIAKCLNVSMLDPTYFQYLYDATGQGTNADAVVAAQANFDSAAAGDATSATEAKTNTKNQILYKELKAADGDVSMTPAVLRNQGK